MKSLYLLISSLSLCSLYAQEVDTTNFPYIQPISVEFPQKEKTVQSVKKKSSLPIIQQNQVENFEDEEFIFNEPEKDKTAILEILFESASYKIMPKSYPYIEKFAEFLQENPSYQAIVYGYTDNINKTNNNKQLSYDRAKSVVNALIDEGIKITRLTAIGMGSKNPIASNDTKEGRAKNRRIEVELLK